MLPFLARWASSAGDGRGTRQTEYWLDEQRNLVLRFEGYAHGKLVSTWEVLQVSYSRVGMKKISHQRTS